MTPKEIKMSNEIKVGSTVGYYVNGEFIIDVVTGMTTTQFPSIGPDQKTILCLFVKGASWVSPEIPEDLPGHCILIGPAPDTYVTADGVTINPHVDEVYHYPTWATDGYPCRGRLVWDVENQMWIGYGHHYGPCWSSRETVDAHILEVHAARPGAK